MRRPWCLTRSQTPDSCPLDRAGPNTCQGLLRCCLHARVQFNNKKKKNRAHVLRTLLFDDVERRVTDVQISHLFVGICGAVVVECFRVQRRVLRPSWAAKKKKKPRRDLDALACESQRCRNKQTTHRRNATRAQRTHRAKKIANVPFPI